MGHPVLFMASNTASAAMPVATTAAPSVAEFSRRRSCGAGGRDRDHDLRQNHPLRGSAAILFARILAIIEAVICSLAPGAV